MAEELVVGEKDGVLYVPVRVKPRASRTRVLGVKQGALEVAVAAPPVDGAANLALLKELARHLGVPRTQLTLVAGSSSKHKRIAVQGITLDRCRERLVGE